MGIKQLAINLIASLSVLTAGQAHAGNVAIDAVEQYALAYSGFPSDYQEMTSGLTDGVSVNVSYPTTLPYNPSSYASHTGSINPDDVLAFSGVAHSQSRIDNRWIYTDRTGATAALLINFTVTDEPVRFNALFVAEVAEENLNPGAYGTDRSIALVRVEPDVHHYVNGHGPIPGTGPGGETWSYLIDPGQYYFQFSVSATPYSRATFSGTEDLIASVDVNYNLEASFTELNDGGVDYSAVLPLSGDLDGDGFVGITDLNIVLGAWNQTVPPADPLADPSGDGFVGIEDLNAILGNWNAGTPPVDGAKIPEPGSMIMLLAATLAIKRTR